MAEDKIGDEFKLGTFRGLQIYFYPERSDVKRQIVARQNGQQVCVAATVAAIKVNINNYLKKSVRLRVIHYGYNEHLEMVELTSWTDEGECWVVNKNGSRSKHREESIYADTAKNHIILKKIDGIKNVMKALTEKQSQLVEDLDRVDFDKLEAGLAEPKP